MITAKYHATHNNFVIFDCSSEEEFLELKSQMVDQIQTDKIDSGLILLPSDNGVKKMLVLEKDGSLSAMCGNGIRAVGKYILDNKITSQKNIDIEILDGIIHLEYIQGNLFMVNMGVVESFEKNPDIFVDYDIVKNPDVDFKNIDLKLKNAKLFATRREPHLILEHYHNDDIILQVFDSIKKDNIFKHNVNINFLEIVENGVVKNLTCERGVDRITLSCGTGSTSVAEYMYQKYGWETIMVINRGGDLIFKRLEDGSFLCTGPADKMKCL